MDVCHNIDGFKAVLSQINTKMPHIDEIKIVLGISKSKKLNEILSTLENDKKITDLYIVSRPHMRLYKSEQAYKLIAEAGTTKLRELI